MLGPTLRTRACALVLSSWSWLLLACDVAGDDGAPALAAPPAADDDDTDTDDTDDTDTEPGAALRGSPAAPARGHVPGLHPCGNAMLDPSEACDDGLANGNDRACTLACEINDCELDAHGVCEPHGPAADVDLYPCAERGPEDPPTVCRVRLRAP